MSDSDCTSNLQQLLLKFRLSHLWPVFKDQNIDEADILPYLKDEQINAITSSIGDKIRLQRLITSLKNTDSEAISEERVETEVETEKHILAPQYQETPLLKHQTEVSKDFIEIIEEPIDIIYNPINQTEDYYLPFTINDDTSEDKAENVTTEIEIESDEKFGNEDSQEDTNTCLTEVTNTCQREDTNTTITNSSCSSTRRSSKGSSYLEKSCSRLQIQKFDLEEFLKKDLLGEALLAKGLRRGLSPIDRDRLTDILIRSLLNQFGKLGFTELEILSKKIEKVFPTEFQYTYFVPPILKGQSSQNVSEKAKGKLIDKQRNLLYLLKTLKKHSKANKDKNEVESISTHGEITQEAKDSHIWLKHNQEPLQQVFEHWKKSFPVRKFFEQATIDEFLDTWPILKTPLAPELIQIDFEKRFSIPGSFDLEAEVDGFFAKVLEKRKNLVSPADNNILELLDTEVTRDSKTAIKLYLLPALVPPKGRTYASKAHWKPSVSECRDSLLVHVLHPADIEEAKKKRVDCMYAKGLTVQPYLLLVGSKLSNITAVFVIINNINYKCLNVVQALEFCYKLYQILDAQYPFAAKHIWYLIQWNIFKYNHKKDPKIPFVGDLIFK